MESAFWNRAQELETLRDWWAHEPRLGVIHGRRRLGKTSLLRHWLGGTAGCYVQATEGTPASQRTALADDLQSVVPGFGEVVYPSWRALLNTLKRQWPARSVTPSVAGGPAEAPVLVLDEFPYLAQSAPELPSVLQAMVDAPDAKRLPIIICGSSQRMMQGLVLDSDAPLYGRAQILLRLQPLSATEIRAALGLPNAITAIEVYAAFGGVPRYWDLMRDRQYIQAEEALEHLVFSPQGILHDEAERVLRDEEAAALERAVCELIGRGARRPSEVAARLGVKDTTLAKPLRHLADLGLIERQATYDFDSGQPVAGGRRAFYKLADPFLAMWYACVRPYLSGLNLGAETARQHAHEAWTHHVAAVWEDLCRQQWHRLGYQDVEWEPAGRYWASRESTGAEWDVVSVSSDRRHVFLGECKWMKGVTSSKVGTIIHALKNRQVPPLSGKAQVHLGLFLPASGKLPPDMDGVAILDAERMLGESGKIGRSIIHPKEKT